MNKQDLLLKLTTAIKQRDEVAKKAFRAVISEIDLADAKENVSNERILSIIKKEKEKFSQSAELFVDTSQELSVQYNECAILLGELIPSEISESEFSSILSELTGENNNFGVIMKSAKERYGSRLDMGKFSKFVKQNS
jgi:uncharacterized protein YqeY